jgi:ABC-type polysaccharide/polyol phosphate export permease
MAAYNGEDWCRLHFGFLNDLREGLKLWRVWGHLGFREIRLEHSGSRAGTLWTMLGLAILIGAQGFLFSVLLGADLRTFFPWFASGLITWIFIASVIASSVGVFRNNRGQMLNINLPYSFYIYKNVTSHLTRFFYYLPIYFIVSLISYRTIHPTAFLAIYGILILSITGLAVGMLLGTIGTRFRVIEYLVPTILPAIFLFTPVMWSVENLGAHTWIAEFNPLFHYIALVRDPLMGKPIPLVSAVVTLAFTTAFFAAAALVYRIWRKTMIFWA